jgi:hypothetical protein
MNEFVSGAIAMASAISGLFFLRFWRQTLDRFFLFFAIAFWIFGASRIILSLTAVSDEGQLAVYVVRLLAFLLILAAIVDKNLPRRSGS